MELSTHNLINQFTNCYLFAKNRKGEYIFCNAKLAEAAGFDSPEQMLGKTDYEACWRKQASSFQTVDNEVINGKSYVNDYIELSSKQKRIPILVTKSQLLNDRGHCIGTIGSCIETVPKLPSYCNGREHLPEKRYYLGNDIYFTRREITILQGLLLGHSNKKIGLTNSISPRTVESHINNIKQKLQCRTRGDIIITAIKLGLIYFITAV